ncbi:Crp/Fnr family transcriptional regulator [Roseomonas fluvialis]|uniref:Crp/Fnr family transcriptional regulator n=1 Tax=Roseomonas fluvialis TaxID=1750527 RepID=A0ABM7Y9Z2_9PROT|nr:Crp/Fnr family transcriptional regulator [Roseomonas fluvialis]BDG74853.1 Crp/Fnr family transcriptional regulator [Roseomonas fluvialis]
MEPPIPCSDCPLRPLAAFKPVGPTALAAISGAKVGQRLCTSGATILAEDQATTRVYVLLSGWAFRFKTLEDGRRQILNFLLPGDLLGLQGELLANLPHGVEALTAVNLCAFATDAIPGFFRDNPDIALDITWLAAHEERLVDDAVLTVGRRTAMERVAALLVHLYKRAASAGLVEDGSIGFPLTQLHIADALGLSVVHTNRVLQRLRKGGFIRLDGQRLAIGDLRAMRRVGRYWEEPAPRRPLL